MFIEQLSLPAILFSEDTTVSKMQGQKAAIREMEEHMRNYVWVHLGRPDEVKWSWRAAGGGWNYADEDLIQLNFG